MPLYTEHWSARRAWLALSIDERIRFLDRLGPAIDRLLASGATLIGVALRESRLLHRDDAQYLALWRMPEGRSQIDMLESALAAVGWDAYFKPVTVAPDALRGPDAPKPPRSSLREGRGWAARNGRRD